MTTTSQPEGRSSAWTRDMLSFWPLGYERRQLSRHDGGVEAPRPGPTRTAPGSGSISPLSQVSLPSGGRRPSTCGRTGGYGQAAQPARRRPRVVQVHARAAHAPDQSRRRELGALAARGRPPSPEPSRRW